MRSLVLVGLLAAGARADPPIGELHEEATRESSGVGVDLSMRMRDQATGVGVGVAAKLVRGDYTLAVGLTRWQTFDLRGTPSQGSWEAAIRVERRFGNVFVGGGLGYERVERGDSRPTRRNLSIGAGYRWKTGWIELTAERKTWDDVLPPGVRDRDELTVMVMLGFTF